MHESMRLARIREIALSVVALACLLTASAIPLGAQTTRAAAESPATTRAIPRGTILPVILQTTINSNKAKPGQIIHGEIAQDVPLANGSKLRRRSKIEGTVVEVLPAPNNSGVKVSIAFSKVYWAKQPVAITTDLRAIAGFMEVLDATTPVHGVGESDVFDWETTQQIGGDSVFGRGGVVTSAHNADEIIGKAPMSGGVLVRPAANPVGSCRGSLDGNDQPQALWVFSSDACGTYGLSNVSVSHAGRTEPVGTFTLEFQKPARKIPSGAGMLLRVIG